MCSILGIFDINGDEKKMRERALTMSGKMRHRGPDWSGTYSDKNTILVHERLSIVGVDSGAQPIYSEDGNQILAVNGEIYNHKELAQNLTQSWNFQTKSDCEIINALYHEKNTGFLNDLNGIFAFILYDKQKNDYLIARDPVGIIPLYMGYDEEGKHYVASEMKALTTVCKQIEIFPPGHYYNGSEGKLIKYYNPDWKKYENTRTDLDKNEIKISLEDAVHRQLMSDVPYGVLLSGGLDSSIISALAARYSRKRIEENDSKDAWWPRLHSFSVGLEGAPDLKAAKVVADYIGSVHHEMTFTVQEGLDALRDVIYHIETYDVTTIRASTPMYLLARKIKSMGVKMVLSGEGADEIFGGYLYFHKAPNAKEFHAETLRKIEKLHMYDCLRANKSMAAWGVECRVPFLDLEFLNTAMHVDAEKKMIKEGKMEKHILRDAFTDCLPETLVWRQKEQFSDGVGYNWIDSLKAHTEAQVSDAQMKTASFRFSVNTPLTKEAYFYRHIFDEVFPGESPAQTVPGGATVACSTAEAIAWDESFQNNQDPSGRAMKAVHNDAYK